MKVDIWAYFRCDHKLELELKGLAGSYCGINTGEGVRAEECETNVSWTFPTSTMALEFMMAATKLGAKFTVFECKRGKIEWEHNCYIGGKNAKGLER